MSASNMFDTRLSKRTKHRPSNTRTKDMFYVFDRVLDGLPSNFIKHDQTRSDTIRHDQTRSNSTKQGVQTVKCLVTKECLIWWCLVAKHLSFVQALRPGSNGVLHMSRIECKWENSFVLPALPELVIVESGIQTLSNCTKNKFVHNLPCGGKFFVGVLFRGFWIFQVSCSPHRPPGSYAYVFTDTKVNNCLSIYHISWIICGPKRYFICGNVLPDCVRLSSERYQGERCKASHVKTLPLLASREPPNSVTALMALVGW